MNNLHKAFDHGKAFIPLITCGDPDLETTEKVVYAMQEAGADLIELGIPFSDPTAEGPVIQEANIRALKNKITTDDIFAMVERLRERVTIPMVFMTYANVIFSYGAEKFMANCRKLGIDGVILPDIPYEEKKEFEDVCKAYDVALISMIAPTSHDRIKMIAAEAEGFIYCVSSLGVTGVRSNISTNIEEMVKSVKEVKDIPVAIGFGINTPEQAAEMARYTDGIIVGSAVIKRLEKYGRDSAESVAEYVRSMKNAIS